MEAKIPGNLLTTAMALMPHTDLKRALGYGDLKAKGDLDQFFAQVDRPRGIHLCGNSGLGFSA